ncbi:arginyl-tRNA synthetase [Peribacillus deserti]|uniref:Arginine--tRNA ligase n=1 Tax=Peribacillus deserti TaxID=673318 RepID=A0ABS2QDH5_9BACI|nr:arginine--tRNA ligase [Peribacillus deserti]MBM7691216.1 arginyl-tRNA synthetase [Peribacillus deserti]
MDYQQNLAEHISQNLKLELTIEDVLKLIEAPKFAEHGDLAFPCFSLAKSMKKSPAVIAEQLAGQLGGDLFEKVSAAGPYVNFFLNKSKVSHDVLLEILEKKHHYGDLEMGGGKNIPIDMSSPNIAKPFSMGHLRSTVIGNALANILQKCGFTPIKINHLGDWGTQFGKLIVAYKAWGDEQKVKENPIKELLKLYIDFHEKAEKDPGLERQGREWFKKLEDGDQEALRLWKWFREESLKEFNKIYDLLNVQFDSYQGEAFYNDKMDDAVKMIDDSGLLVEDQGAMVVKLDEENLPPSLIKKSDGATLYVTRDLAAAIYRHQIYDFAQAVYVVGNEQTLHFKQLKLVLKKLGLQWSDHIVHVPFGMILKDGKKMSTRKGKVVLLEDVLSDSIKLAERNILAKNPHLQNKAEIARQVGVGAVIFHDLHHERMNTIEFSLEDMLKFEGETGPYLQYTYARARSILRKASILTKLDPTAGLKDPLAWEVIKLLIDFPKAVERAYHKYEPSIVSKYLIDLAQAFNRYYGNVRILEENAELQTRLQLVEAAAIVLKEGLALLGIAAPEEM